ncbi:hypothetical protein [Microvirga sp. VF16]|uniref:hypothetical protein n=1 Tax=Microvirga sp. VF16 TaxID=2807101 RepID=UPI00193D594B|nr:hypothetical protein [Microvirga sp. VF16]QRM33219.1 hypothetical protein JO965_28495 [Microvirga sp. VF16]
MTKGSRPKPDESISSVALSGCLIGIAAVALHQIHHAITNSIPEPVYTHALTELIAGASGDAILFAAIAFLRGRLKARR